MKITLAIVAVLFFVTTLTAKAEIHNIYVDADKVHNIYKQLGFMDVVAAKQDGEKYFYTIYAEKNEISKLVASGAVLIEESVQKKTLSENPEAPPFYMNYDELLDFMKELEETYPDLAKVYSIGYSYENREIKALKVSLDPSKNVPDKTEAVFVGVHHAREWISMEVSIHLGRFILENYSKNERIKAIVDSSEIWIIPVLNPDGYVFSWEESRMWRNNRRDHGDGTFGVDLNRNYDSGWVENENFHGSAPFSEPETQTLRAFVGDEDIESEYNDEVQGMFSYHSYSQLILYPPGSTEEPAFNKDTLHTIGENMAALIFEQTEKVYIPKSVFELYPVYGGMSEWFHTHHDGKPSYTIELRPEPGNSQGFKLFADQIEPCLRENIPAALYFMEYLISGETDVDTDVNGDGVVDYYEGVDWSEAAYFEEPDEAPEADTESPDSEISDDEKVEADSYNDDETLDNDVSVSDEDKTENGGSGCSLVI